ncbi:MAG: T9SS type A sorting domain-containing protein [Burkholderiales bacterium]|nr:T9SS type A sorting domain-containing protein [Flavobacterium sp.]
MKKQLLSFLILFAIQSTVAQNSKLWKGYFSYNEIKDLAEAPNKIVAASENALFSKDLVSGTIKTTNTIDGLSGLTISSIYHSANFKKTLIGYENGLMIVIDDVTGAMLNVVDIINKALPPNIKKINHFMEYNGIAYLSCDFGIVQYNLATLQFGDTYFIGNNGAQIIVKQTAVFQDRIYAATFTNGMRSALITNPNLNDFNQWTTLDANGWTGVETFGTNLLAVSNTGFLYTWQGATFGNPVSLLQPSTDMRKSGTYLIVTTPNHVYIYNAALTQIRNLNSNEIVNEVVKFSCATVTNDDIYVGTVENGLYVTSLSPATFDNITPAGATRNAVFAINATTQNLWAVYGGYDINYNPYTYFGFSPAQFGISKFNNQTGWKHIRYENLLGAKALSRITINPSNENQVFISSFFSGLLKLENDQAVTLYDESNTGSDGLQPIGGVGPENIWINGAAFDKTGNLWLDSSLQTKALKVFQANGQWKSFNLQGIYSNFNLFKLGKIVIDKNGTKWMSTLNDGVIAFNETYSNTEFKTIRETDQLGNLPSNDTKAIAVDNRNQLWIGTRKGLRVLSSVDIFLSEGQMTSDPIIFNETIDGTQVAQELLYEQSITDIVVDGANNKWIGTADSGVFLVSPNGQQTIHHFDETNSPLPSNSINDIDISGTTGEVFFATTKGMVSFKGTATDANDNLNNVFVFPNPVRPNYYGTVKVSGLLDQAHVKITDIEGNLVYETVSEGGTLEWDTMAFGKYKVASGVYMIFISAEDGSQTKVKKVMIIR